MPRRARLRAVGWQPANTVAGAACAPSAAVVAQPTLPPARHELSSSLPGPYALLHTCEAATWERAPCQLLCRCVMVERRLASLFAKEMARGTQRCGGRGDWCGR